MILKHANLDHELGQSDVHPNLDDGPLSMNEPTVEPPPVELPDEPSDKPPCTKLVFHFDINPVDFYHHTDTNYYGFCPGTSAYLDTSLDNLGLGNTYKNFRTDPGNGLGITATFKPKPNAERGAGGIDSSID